MNLLNLATLCTFTYIQNVLGHKVSLFLENKVFEVENTVFEFSKLVYL